MSNWKFRQLDSLEETLLNDLGLDYMAPQMSPDVLKFFHNGDIMKINIKTGEMRWDPLRPGELGNSKLSLRLHTWFSKGVIIPDKEANETEAEGQR